MVNKQIMGNGALGGGGILGLVDRATIYPCNWAIETLFTARVQHWANGERVTSPDL